MRSILTVGGVGIGIGAIVFLVSLGFGLEQLVTNQVANFEAFSIIDIPSANVKSGKIDAAALDKIRAIGHVQDIERIIDLAGRVRIGEQNSTTETVVVAVETTYFDVADVIMTHGKLYQPGSKTDTVISTALANLLGYEGKTQEILNQRISLDLIISKELREKDETDGPVVKEGIALTVVGVSNETDSPTLYLSIPLVESYGVVNTTSLKVHVDDQESVPTVRKQIENLGFFTEHVGDTVNQITQVFGILRLILGGFGAIALIVAAIGAFNTLTISLIERIREVSLLKMLGMKRYDIFRLFITESLTIGMLGGIAGAMFGTGVGFVANQLITRLAERSGADPVTIFVTPPMLIIIIAGGSIVVGFFTGFYPSYRAIKTNPLDALRYE
jgi:putative ABC transport system permease protein